MPSTSRRSQGLSNEELLSKLQEAYPLIDSALLAAMVHDISNAEKRPEAIDNLLSDLETLTLQARADSESQILTEEDSSIFTSETNSLRREGTESSATSSGVSTLSDGPLAFLARAFPFYSQAALKEAYEAEVNKRGGNDVHMDMEVVVQELLSRELIKELEERDLDETEAICVQSPTQAEAARDWSAVATKQKGKKKAKKERDKTNTPKKIVLGGAQHRYHPSCDTEALATTSQACVFPADVDPWTHFSSLATRFSELLPPLSTAHFLSLLHGSGSDPPGQILRRELDKIAQDNRSYPVLNSTNQSTTLKEILADASLYDDADLCWHASKYDIDIALQLVWLLVDLDDMTVLCHPVAPLTHAANDRQDGPASNILSPISSTTSLSGSIPMPSSSRQSDTATWTTVTRRPRQKAKYEIDPLAAHIPAYQNMPAGWRTQTGRASGEPGMDEENLTEQQCRYWAEYYQKRRDVALKDASRYWKKNSTGRTSNGGGDVAFFYAEDGREQDRRSKMWALEAARMMVERRKRTSHVRDTVDLHGLTVNEALILSREAADQWWETGGGEIAPARHLTIVTGKGNHSKGGVSIIGPAVYNALELEGWRVTKKPGAVLVTNRTRRNTRLG